MSARWLRKDDTVMVIAGRERGKTGKVLRVLAEKDRVLIERINMVKKHAKPRGVQPAGARGAFSVRPPCPRAAGVTASAGRRRGSNRSNKTNKSTLTPQAAAGAGL